MTNEEKIKILYQRTQHSLTLRMCLARSHEPRYYKEILNRFSSTDEARRWVDAFDQRTLDNAIDGVFLMSWEEDN